MRSAWMALVMTAAACGGGDGTAGKVVFVTSAEFDGGFAASQPASIDAASMADTQCQTAAQGAGFDGTFVAWMSRGGTNTQPQRDAIAVISSEGPWRTTNGELAFLNHSALVNTPQVPIGYDQYGESVFGQVWTGTKVGGTLDLYKDCTGWHTGSGSMGIVGSSYANDSRWTDDSEYPCELTAHFYCFEL